MSYSDPEQHERRKAYAREYERQKRLNPEHREKCLARARAWYKNNIRKSRRKPTNPIDQRPPPDQVAARAIELATMRAKAVMMGYEIRERRFAA